MPLDQLGGAALTGSMPASLGVVNSQHHSAAAGASSCGLLKWCYSAVKFAALPIHRDGAEVAIFTNNASATATESSVRMAPVPPIIATRDPTTSLARRSDSSRSSVVWA